MNKIAVQLVAALFLLAAIASCDKVRAEEYIEKGLSTAKAAVVCFTLGEEMGLPPYELKVYIDRVGVYKFHPSIMHAKGYYTGVLDVYGSTTAEYFGSFKAAKLDAAKSLYRLLSCSSAEEI